MVALFGVPASADTAQQGKFQQALEQFLSSDFKDISEGVSLLAESGDERAIQVLTLLFNGELYVHRAESRLVVIVGQDGSKPIIKALFADESAETETVSKRRVKRVGINNQLRGKIKTELALLNLSSPDASKRAAAVKQTLGDADQALFALLTEQLTSEQDKGVRDLIEVALAIYQLDSSESSAEQKIEALNTLGASYQPDARNAVSQFLNSQPEAELKDAAEQALSKLDGRVKVAGFVETLFFGLSLGSVLVLAAIGLTITFGVMGVINMAHGELMMLGAYTTYVIQTLMPEHIATSIFLAIPAAFVVSGLAGIAIERGVIRFLYGRPLETLLATFGISLILQQTVRSIFSPLNRSVTSPEFMTGVLEINPMLSLTLNRLYIILFCLIVFALLFFILRYTRLGLEVRAVSQNRAMARAMGVRSEWVDAMTFGLGSGIAGMAGVALSQLTNVGPNLGQAYIIDSFMVVVFGGVGNLWGTLVAGMSLGIANKLIEPWAGAVLAKILVLVFIILFIQKKPRGLFPQKGRSAEG
jgi:urea transport system permease protein